MTPAALADLVRATAVDVLTSRHFDHTAPLAVVTVQRRRKPEHGDHATDIALRVVHQPANRGTVGVVPLRRGWQA